MGTYVDMATYCYDKISSAQNVYPQEPGWQHLLLLKFGKLLILTASVMIHYSDNIQSSQILKSMLSNTSDLLNLLL